MTSAEDLASLQGREKLEQKVIDFERLDQAGLEEGQWDVVFIAYVCSLFRVDEGCAQRSFRVCGRLGTSLKAAGSQENFTKIDKECV